MAGQYSRALLKFRSTYGEGLFDPGDAYEDENVIILHGRHARSQGYRSNVDVDRQLGSNIRRVRPVHSQPTVSDPF
jgi:hypothetical protein